MLSCARVRHRYEGRVVLELAQSASRSGAGGGESGTNGAGKSTLLAAAMLERRRKDRCCSTAHPRPVPRRAQIAAPARAVVERDGMFRGTCERTGIRYAMSDVRTDGGERTSETSSSDSDASRYLSRAPVTSVVTDGEVQRVARRTAIAVAGPNVLLLDEHASRPTARGGRAVTVRSAAERATRSICRLHRRHNSSRTPYRWSRREFARSQTAAWRRSRREESVSGSRLSSGRRREGRARRVRHIDIGDDR